MRDFGAGALFVQNAAAHMAVAAFALWRLMVEPMPKRRVVS